MDMRLATRWYWSVAAVAAGATLVGLVGGDARVAGAPPSKSIVLTPVGVYRTGAFDRGAAEIAAYDAATRRLFVVNLDGQRVDVLDISTPTTPVLMHWIDVTPWGSQANSVATHNGVVAVAIEARVKTDSGTVAFFDAYGGLLGAVAVGALPDMLTFSPNGRTVLVANEGEPNSYGQLASVDPEGSVSLIDLSGGVAMLSASAVTTAGFAAYNAATLDPSIRRFGPGASVAQDMEPEYIAVSHDSRTAWVTLQENNALAVIDLVTKQVTHLVGLGFKDHSLPGHGFDGSDRDGQSINIIPRPVWGMYQPDAIEAFRAGGKTLLLTANEGDVREWPGLPGGSEAARVGSLNLDPAAFPDSVSLKANASLGRLNVTRYNGDTDGDGDFDQLYAFGARSFSIWTTGGALVFDSGDALEQLVRDHHPDYFNATHTNNDNLNVNPNNWTRDSRSDDKGPEPETVKVARLFGRQYVFVALERIGGVAIYDLTNVAAPVLDGYVNVRGFGQPANSSQAEDLGPEGMLVIPAEDSPNGRPLLVLANEISGTTRIFEISRSER